VDAGNLLNPILGGGCSTGIYGSTLLDGRNRVTFIYVQFTRLQKAATDVHTDLAPTHIL
jgi:hypothetical protein